MNDTIRTYPVGNGDTRSIATRLGAALSGRTQPERAAAVARILESEGEGPGSGVDGLLADIALAGQVIDTAASVGVTVLPRSPRRRRLSALTAGAVLAAGLSVLAGSASASASASAVTLPPVVVVAPATPAVPALPPVALVLSGPTVVVRVPVPAGTTVAWLQTTTGAVRLPVRRGYAAAMLASAAVRPGESVLELGQRSGGAVRVLVTARRASRVSAPMLTVYPGMAFVTGIASHYDPHIGGYAGDVASPVQVQTATIGGRWTTTATLTTDPTGTVAGVVPLPAGPVLVRLVRPVGATVTGGTGIPVLASGQACRSARGDAVDCC